VNECDFCVISFCSNLFDSVFAVYFREYIGDQDLRLFIFVVVVVSVGNIIVDGM